MILRLLSYLKPQWKTYALVCGLGLLVAVLEMVPPKLVGNCVNLLATAPAQGFKAAVPLAAVWIAITLVVQLSHAVQIRQANRAGENVLARMREELFEHLQRLSMSYFDKTHVGRIISTATGDLDSVRNILIWGMNTFVANAALMILAAVMIYLTDKRIFVATFWLAPLMTIVNFYFGRRVTRAWQTVRLHSTLVGANQAENIAGVRVVAAFNRQEDNLELYNRLQQTNTVNNVNASKVSGLFQPMLQQVRFIGQVIILAYGGYGVATSRLSAGNLVSASLYWDFFMQPAVNFGVFINDLLVAVSGAERIFEILDEKPEVQDIPGAQALPRLRGDVCFENVSFSYNAYKKVLRDVSFDIPAGTNVALVGSTGSGKTTIVSLLARFYAAQSGRITVDGLDISQFTAESLHQQMAMVLQSNFLFTGTLMENLKYANPEATDDDVYKAARTLGCHERFLKLKNGYETAVTEKGSSLSVGERQLICFTRALVANPTILLLDEATSALDPLTGFQVQQALKELIQGRTTFMVTHRMNTAAAADLVIVLDDGMISEIGTPEELLSRGGKFAEFYNHTYQRARRLTSARAQARPPVPQPLPAY